MNCHRCGEKLDSVDIKFCPVCGEAVETTPPPAPKKKKPWWVIVLMAIVAILLVSIALVLLGLGIVVVLIVFGINISKSTPAEPITTPTGNYEEYEPEESVADLLTTTLQTTTTTTTTKAATLVMPSFEGQDSAYAESYLSGLGFEVVLAQAYSDLAVGCVVSQSHAEGVVVEPSDTIVLVVSEGPQYRQKVVVTAPQGSSFGQMTVYEWSEGTWEVQFSCAASVGRNGIGANYGEGKGISPEGTFKIGVALAANGVNTYDWPVERVTLDTCIVDDVDSPYYNTIQLISSLPEGVHYDTIGNTLINGFSDVCIFIEHNGNGYTSDGVVAGKGSVITICSKDSTLEPTAGCVDISTADMMALLRVLDTTQNPHIEIAVQ